MGRIRSLLFFRRAQTVRRRNCESGTTQRDAGQPVSIPADIDERRGAPATEGKPILVHRPDRCVPHRRLCPAGRNALRLGYDLFVKDQPDSPEWVCYDNPEEAVCLEEDAMCAALDRLVQGHRLSYTECCFSSLDGKMVKKGPHDMGLGLR